MLLIFKTLSAFENDRILSIVSGLGPEFFKD